MAISSVSNISPSEVAARAMLPGLRPAGDRIGAGSGRYAVPILPRPAHALPRHAMPRPAEPCPAEPCATGQQ